jgi:hypothetical protein
LNTSAVIALARKHVLADEVAMRSSAEHCLAEALSAQEKGSLEYAKQWALRSLKYSVGVFHADYKRAEG